MTMRNQVAVSLRAGDRHAGFRRAAAGDAETAEFRLAAACCRWPPSPARDAAVRSAAAAVTDWDRFAQLAIARHRVAVLVRDALLSAGVIVPLPIAENLTRRAQRIARRNMGLATETVRLQRAFDAAGIAAVALKGVAVGQLAYGSFAAKHTKDIDFLVPPERAEEAMQLLKRENYRLKYPAADLSTSQRRAIIRYNRQFGFVHRSDRLLVEPHWYAAANPLLLQGIDAYSATQNVVLSEGNSVRTLATEDLFAYLCVHGARHAWSRLKWLADLNALIRTNGADPERLYRHAHSRGAGICAGLALLLCHRLFDLSLPTDLISEFQGQKRLRTLAAVAMKTMTATYAESHASRSFVERMRVMLAQFLLGRGWEFFFAECRWASVRTLDMVDLPLPPALHFLYPLLRLPLWLWRHAKTAGTRNRA